MLDAIQTWSARRWWVATAAAVATALVVGVPTAVIPTPVFGRAVPTTWWAWPTLVLTALLGAMLVATYVPQPGDVPAAGRLDRKGTLGGLLSFFAVGCPVCNKLALIALGYTGALQWFAPVQPVLAVAGVALLAWALRARLRGQLACPVTPAPAGEAREPVSA